MCSKQRKRFGPFLFGVLILFSVTCIALDAPATEPEPQKVVLALYGSRPDLPANVIVDEVIRSTLERELGPRLDFYAEFLDTARWPEAEAQSAMRDLLRRRYAHKKLSAIIVVARPAINFIRLYGDELFPGVPIVVYGDLDSVREWEPGRPITGSLGKVDLSGTAELILRLQPQTREILVISGASASDQWLQSLARHQLDQLEKRVKLTYMDTGSVEDFVSTVAQVPDGTVILFLSMYQDSAGNKLLSHEVLSRIARAARVPVYNQGGSHVGLGIVGGVVFNPESLGRETAQLTLRVLRGERLQDLPLQESKSTVPLVDWRQLKRWGLDEKRLPPGTIIRFREVSVWQRYKWYIIGGISLIVAETLLIFGLIWQRARRRKTEAALRESEGRFRLVANTAPVMIWMSGTDGPHTYFNRPWLEFTGRSLQGELGNGWSEGVHPEDLKTCLDTYTSAFDRREPFEMEYRLRRHDGEYRWILGHGVPRFNADGSFAGYIGSAADATERKLAQEALSSVSRRLIEAQEEERTWVARELHDDFNQRIALLSVNLEGLKQDLRASDDQTRGRFTEIQERVSDLGSDIQALSHRLHSSKLDYLGLAAAAESFCKELSAGQNLEIAFQSQGIPKNLPQEISLCIFRILQEALQNAVKYSGARRFEVSLVDVLNEIELTVHDSGAGFDPEKAIGGYGLGLTSMKERLKIVDGDLAIDSKPQGGTTIRAKVPLRPRMKVAGAVE